MSIVIEAWRRDQVFDEEFRIAHVRVKRINEIPETVENLKKFRPDRITKSRTDKRKHIIHDLYVRPGYEPTF